MKRLAVILALSLTSCAGPSFSLFHAGDPPAKPVAAPAPQIVCPAAIGGPLIKRPAAPANAGYPQPQTDAEAQAVAALRLWMLDVVNWANAGWKIVDNDNKVCAAVTK